MLSKLWANEKPSSFEKSFREMVIIHISDLHRRTVSQNCINCMEENVIDVNDNLKKVPGEEKLALT